MAKNFPFRSASFDNLRRQRSSRWGESDVRVCVYEIANCKCRSTDWIDPRWPYSQGWENLSLLAVPTTEPFGLLLDLDEGTLTLYQNGQQLGTAKSGLSGEYTWFVDLYGNTPSEITIKRQDLPAHL